MPATIHGRVDFAVKGGNVLLDENNDIISDLLMKHRGKDVVVTISIKLVILVY
jgi:hypothetical protein